MALEEVGVQYSLILMELACSFTDSLAESQEFETEIPDEEAERITTVQAGTFPGRRPALGFSSANLDNLAIDYVNSHRA